MAKKKSGCPCGGDRYETCCAPLHRGAVAATAEALMRSRFTAFVKRDADYLWKTLHSQHEARRQDEAEWKAALLRDAPSYTSLRIVETAEPDGDGVARVLFVVRYRAKGRARVAAELSFFAQEDAWRYIDGILTDAASATSIAAVEGR